MPDLPTWVTESAFMKENSVTFNDLPEDIQMVILNPSANPYELLKTLSFFLYYVVPSIFLPFMTNVDLDQCPEGIDGLFLLQDVKDFQAMMRGSLLELEGDEVVMRRDMRHRFHVRGRLSMTRSAERGKLEWLIYLRQTGHPWLPETCAAAANHGHLVCLQYLHANGCPWGESVHDLVILSEAAYNGHLPCLMYCHQQNFPDRARGLTPYLDPAMFVMNMEDLSSMKALEAACYGKHLDCFRYLHEQGYTSDLNLCAFAAYNKSMDCLKYACEVIGDPLDFTVTVHGMVTDFVGCVEYVHLERGCPWNKDILVEALIWGAYKSFKFAYENGCPIPADVSIVALNALPDWFISSHMVRECAPVPATAIFTCLDDTFKTTILNPEPARSALAKTLEFLGTGPFLGDDDSDG